jgi:hypothetical protein
MCLNRVYLFIFMAGAAISFVGCLPMGPTVSGEVRTKRTADTLTVDYELEPDGRGHTIDSLSLSVGDTGSTVDGDSLLFSRASNVSDLNPTRTSDLSKNRDRLRGRLTYMDPNSSATHYQMHIYTSGGFWSERINPYTERYPLRTPPGYGMLLGLGYTIWDRLQGRDQTFVTRDMDGVDFAIGGIAYREKLTATLLGSIRGGYDDVHDLTVLELSLGGRYQYSGRDRMWPAPCGAVVLHAVRTLSEPDSVTTGSPGVSAGLVMEKKYERFTYTYNTYLGGFHKCEALFAFAASPRSKIGTLYTFSSGEDIREFRVAIYMEGMSSAGSPMRYAGRRSVIQKTLSAGFFAPFYLLFELFALME